MAEVDSGKLSLLRQAQANDKTGFDNAKTKNDQAGMLDYSVKLNGDNQAIIKFLQDIYFKTNVTYSAGAYNYRALVIKVNGLQDCLSALDKKGLIIYKEK